NHAHMFDTIQQHSFKASHLKRLKLITKTFQRGDQIAIEIGSWIYRNVSRAADSDMHHFTHAIGKPQGTRFRYARESASEVGVVLHRHEAIQGEHSDGCIETRLIACLLIDAAA